MRRYLTPAAKLLELERWARLREEAARDGFTGDPGRPGGHGYVDRGVLPLTDALNAIEGVCTLQSCEGHTYPNRGADDGYRCPDCGERVTHTGAQLWLWLEEGLARALYERAEALSGHESIEQVAFLWGRDRDREVVDLVFRPGFSADFLPRWLRELSARERT